MLRFFLFFVIILPLPALAAPQVVATIAPLAGIAAAVMQGVAAPGLLISNNASPHTYQLKPSDMTRLNAADIVVWDGAGLENFLAGKLATLAPAAQVIGMMDEDADMHHLPVRHGDDWEGEAEEGGEHHDHGADDPHAWLDPDNAVRLAVRLAEALSAKDPAHAATYKANADRFAVDTQRLDAELKQALAPVAGRGFIVFHDAYQYFERRYGLRAVGSITLAPDVPPSGQRLAALRGRITAAEVVCVFAEPQFNPSLVKTLVEGTAARTGVLNPDASDMAVTPTLYSDYMRRLATGFSGCLNGA